MSRRHTYTHTDAEAYIDTAADSSRDTGGAAHDVAITDSNAHVVAADANSYIASDTHANPNRRANIHAVSHADTDSDPDAHSNTAADAYPNSDVDPHSTHTHTHTHTDANGNSTAGVPQRSSRLHPAISHRLES